MGLKTEWFDTVNRECPLNDYPRPQFVRKDWQCLNGQYDFAITDLDSVIPEKFVGKILVPFAVESELSGVGRALDDKHLLWYKRDIVLDECFKGKKVILHFTSVDWIADVYVNRNHIGQHKGGYNPFSFDITDYVTDNCFELIVKVFDPTDKGHQQRGKQVLNPVGFFYTSTSGIWQTVWCEPVGENRIDSIKLLPDIDRGEINIESFTVGNGVIHATVLDGEKTVFDGDIDSKASISIKDFKLWSPENPFLYTLKLTFADDSVSSYFGMRKFSVVNDDNGIPRLGLNNKPYFMKGLLDQGYWPESQLTAPTDDAMIFDIQKMKDLGFNMLRKHIKEEPARWYYHCDRLGMLVWQDMISGGKALNLIYAGALPNINVHVKDNQYKVFHRDEPEWREEFKEELFELIDNLYNFTSICCWVPFNEGWGQFDAKEIGEKIKAYDSSRFVDHASGWHDQHGPDFKSIHKYVLPVHAPTARRTEGRPIVLSEFGGYQNRVENHCWSDAPSFGLYLKFKDKDSLTKAYSKLHYSQVLPLVSKGLCATVYTQVSDVECELNGMYTYDRKFLKLDENTVRKINQKFIIK